MKSFKQYLIEEQEEDDQLIESIDWDDYFEYVFVKKFKGIVSNFNSVSHAQPEYNIKLEKILIIFFDSIKKNVSNIEKVQNLMNGLMSVKISNNQIFTIEIMSALTDEICRSEKVPPLERSKIITYVINNIVQIENFLTERTAGRIVEELKEWIGDNIL